jgi:sulfite exporter TauE/SafE
MIWTALIMGFAGSLHCLGMCSPLVMAVTNMSPAFLLNRLLYNVGRIFTYGILGSVVSSIGFVFPLFKIQNLLSILLGVVLIAIGLTKISRFKIQFLNDMLGSINRKLKVLFNRFIQRKNLASVFLLGSLNGLLPCGLSFLALASCLSFARPAEGFGFMLFFGIGTLPVMLGFTSIFNLVLNRFNFRITSLTKGMLIVSGLLLIVRVFFIHFPTASHGNTLIDTVVCR